MGALKKAIQIGQVQSGVNRDTAITQAEMNMINQVGPQGTTTYSQTGTSANGNPLYTVTQTLSPTQQAIQDKKDALSGTTLSNANTVLAKPADYGTVPTMQGVTQNQVDLNTGYVAPQLETGFQGGTLDNSYTGANLDSNFSNSNLNTDFTGQGQNIIYDLGKERLDPLWAQREQTLESELAAKGIRPGMEAYNNAKMEFAQQRNDAYNQLMLSGLETAAGIAGQEFSAGLSQNQFNSGQLSEANQAKLLQAGITNQQLQLINQGKIDQANLTNQQMQLVNQAKSEQAAATNSQISQMNATQLQEAVQNNQAALQEAQANNDAAQTQYLMQQQAELLSRQQALQEAQGATTMGQVAPIGTIGTPQTGVANTDIAGLTLGLKAQQQAQQNALLGGLGSLAGTAGNVASAYMLSDRRAKTDIKRIGKLDDGTKVYSYRYKGSPLMTLGVMAQEVQKTHPEAVGHIGGGLLGVDYGKLSKEAA